MERFVILSTQRSGSSVLVRTLDQHPQIFCAAEMFNDKLIKFHPEWYFKPWSIQSKALPAKVFSRAVNYANLKLNSFSYLDKFYNASVKNETARGFKIMRNQINQNKNILSYFKKHEVKAIVLIRKNIFKNALSRFKMRETGIAHNESGSHNKSSAINIPAKALIHQMRNVENANEDLKRYAAQLESVNIFYEDFEDWQKTFHKIFTFLQVNAISLPPALTKLSTGNWQEEVLNYSEIESSLKKAGFDNFLN